MLSLTIQRMASFVNHYFASPGCQNAVVKPSCAKICWASAIVRPVKSGCIRSPYQRLDSTQVCSGVRMAPRGRCIRWHHRSTCSSDRKRSIVSQVKIRSSYQRRKGTAKSMTTGTSPVACRSLVEAVCVWRIDNRPTANYDSREVAETRFLTLKILRGGRFPPHNLISSVVKLPGTNRGFEGFTVFSKCLARHGGRPLSIIAQLCLFRREKRRIPLPAQGW